MSHTDVASRRIVTLTPNPALDLSYVLARITHGSSHRVASPLTRAGGKGLNVARVAHQQGYPVLALAPVGGFTGEQFSQELLASTVPHRLIPIRSETRRSLAFVESELDDTTMLNETGHPLTPSEWQTVAAAVVDSLDSASVLVSSGSLPPEAPVDLIPALVTLAHQAGIPAIVDVSGPALLDAARAGADLLKPNHHELREATGEQDLSMAARRLLQLGAGAVVVSSGTEGMKLFRRDTPVVVSARLNRVLSGNPTGAGDAAVAGLATCLAEGVSDPQIWLRRAVAWSAAAVLMPGAGDIHESHEELAHDVVISIKEDA